MNRSRIRLPMLVLAAIAALAGIGYLGYVRSERARQTVTVRAGLAYASSVQAVVQTGGWSYDVPLDVPWIDSTGTEHVGGRSSCLPAFKQTSIHFGTVNITVPGGASQRSVVWVRWP